MGFKEASLVCKIDASYDQLIKALSGPHESTLTRFLSLFLLVRGKRHHILSVPKEMEF